MQMWRALALFAGFGTGIAALQCALFLRVPRFELLQHMYMSVSVGGQIDRFDSTNGKLTKFVVWVALY